MSKMKKEVGKKGEFFGKGIPQIKKKISAFLIGEEGRISKKSMLKIGALLAIPAFAMLNQKTATAHSAHESHSSHTSHSSHNQGWHNNSLSAGYAGGTATATHSHCYNTSGCHTNY